MPVRSQLTEGIPLPGENNTRYVLKLTQQFHWCSGNTVVILEYGRHQFQTLVRLLTLLIELVPGVSQTLQVLPSIRNDHASQILTYSTVMITFSSLSVLYNIICLNCVVTTQDQSMMN